METAQRLMGELVEIEGCMTPVIVAAPLAIVQVRRGAQVGDMFRRGGLSACVGVRLHYKQVTSGSESVTVDSRL